MIRAVVSARLRSLLVSIYTGSYCRRRAVQYTCILHITLKGPSRQMKAAAIDQDVMKLSNVRGLQRLKS